MRAVRFTGVGKPLEVVEMPVPEPGAGEVLVQVKACGVCLSDVHVIDGSLPSRAQPPVTMGHESAGVITTVGPNAGGWNEGDRVVVFGGRSCGVCASCMQMRPIEECLLPSTMGVDYHGAWADYVVVPASGLARLPDEIPFEIGAILTDAVATPFSAVFETGALRAGERVAIFGVGGLGTHAVMLAKLGGASFIAAIDPRPSARERALRLGATVALEPDGAPAAIGAATGGLGVDVAFDFVGANDVLKSAVASLGMHARAVVVGVGGEPIKLGPSILFAFKRTQLRGAYGYQMRHLQALIRLVSSGRLDLSGSITERFALEDTPEAVDALANKRGDPVRLVVIP